MKLSIIANPVSGGGRAYRLIQCYVRKWPHQDWQVEILTTRGPNHAGELARELLPDPPDLLAVCGGDGTLNEVASQVPAPPFPIAIIPAGTANVVARELAVPLDPGRALQVALGGAEKRIDLGELGPVARRRFLFVTGIGFDAYVVSRVRHNLKARIGMAAYAAAIVSCLHSYDFPEFQVVAGDQSLTATSCLVSNARSYGGGLLFSPDADMSDGELDLLILQGSRRIALARFLFQAWRGIPESHSWVHRLRTKSVRIEGRRHGILVQADGELAAGLPLEVTLLPSTFPLVIPRKTKKQEVGSKKLE
jgi:diacylglycerol kinase (ATP)